MDADRWSRIEALYHEVAGLDRGDRAAFLARACGDDRSILAEIDSLLVEDAAASFLEETALAAAARLVADEVPLLIGRVFGPYRIDALIGAGAMGDVYRARDTVLERDVAIKILPEAFSDDPAWLSRFTQEAQFLASLSHPNIAAIYGMHESEGVRGLVLELVDGETLAERLRRGPMPLHEQVRIARQIGEGLDAAHLRGIVHRDLKPSNITIARDGTAKILDFGLAKSASGGGDDGWGTASYMSPEQARGDAVDRRTDIWAFGAVCFEMLTGVPAFRRARGQVRTGGPNWALIPPEVPSGITALLKRCLDEDPKRRRRDIGDVLVDLEDALQPVAPLASRSDKLRWVAAGVALLIMVAVASLRWSRSADSGDQQGPLTRTSLLLPSGMDFPDRDNQIAISPDGTIVAYVAATAGAAARLVLRRLDAESEQLVGDAIDVRDPFFSPDGRYVGFIAGDTIRQVSVFDGQSRVLSTAAGAVSATWSDTGILFGEGGDLPKAGIRRVPQEGGSVQTLSIPDRQAGQRNHTLPQLLPDGRTLLYTVRAFEAAGAVHRVVVQAPGEPARVVVDDSRFGRLIGNSVVIYQRGTALFATRFNLDTLTTSGPDVMLFNDVSPGRPIWAAGGEVLVYRPQNDNRRFVWVGRNGGEVSVPGPARLYGAPSLSPSGGLVAAEIDDGGKFDVWILDVERQALTRVTTDGASRYPMWTPDGSRLGFARRGENSVFWQRADGTDLQELIRSRFGSWIGSWTPDMRSLIYMYENPQTRSDLWITDLQNRARPRPLVQTNAREYGGRVSPDGRWLAYFSDAGNPNQFALYVTPLSGRGPGHLIAKSGAREAVWARNGDELFYRNGRQMMSFRIPRDGDFSSSRPVVLFEGNYFSTGGPGIVNFDVSSDGQRFLMLKAVDEGRTPHLTVVQGLARLIRDRLPPAVR